MAGWLVPLAVWTSGWEAWNLTSTATSSTILCNSFLFTLAQMNATLHIVTYDIFLMAERTCTSTLANSRAAASSPRKFLAGKFRFIVVNLREMLISGGSCGILNSPNCRSISPSRNEFHEAVIVWSLRTLMSASNNPHEPE